MTGPNEHHGPLKLTPETIRAIRDDGLDQHSRRWVLVALCESWMQQSGLDFAAAPPSLSWPDTATGEPSFRHTSFRPELHKASLNNYLQAHIRTAKQSRETPEKPI